MWANGLIQACSLCLNEDPEPQPSCLICNPILIEKTLVDRRTSGLPVPRASKILVPPPCVLSDYLSRLRLAPRAIALPSSQS